LARGQKTFPIDGHPKPFTVYELTVGQIIDLFDGKLGGDLSMAALWNNFTTTLLPLASTLTDKDVRALTPTELRIVYDAFLEVNATFFDLVKTSGIPAVLGKVKDAVAADILNFLVRSLNRATLGSSTTAINTSS
jgi:hypothetical protein